MFANELIEDGSLRTDERGFRFAARLNWYRALPLSSIEMTLSLDDEPVDPAAITFTVDGESYRLAELADRDDRMWYILDGADVHVDRPEGLTPGPHELSLTIGSRIPYIPIAARPPDVLVQEDTCVKTMVVS